MSCVLMPRLRIRRVQERLKRELLAVLVNLFARNCSTVTICNIIFVMKELVDVSAVLHYEDYNISLTIGSEVEVTVQDPPALEGTNTLEEDPTPVWPGGPPPWWENDYAGDIYENLKKSENEFPDIGYESPNLYDRPNLVNFIFDVADVFEASFATKFLAVRLLDGYMDKHSVMMCRLKLMAIASFSIAVKFEDVDYDVPSMISVMEAGRLDRSFTLDDFKTMERYLLEFYKWKISHPTPIHFIDFYLHFSALGENFCSFDYKAFHQLSYDLLKLSLQDTNFILFKPSLVAATAVLTARSLLGIIPYWTDHMTAITGYCYEELETVATMMMKLFHDSQQQFSVTTRCAIEETRSIGDDLIGALLVAKRFQQRNCGHKHKCIPAVDCFTSLVGSDNSNHFFVATQDVELRRKLRKIPGVPLLYINRNTIVLEGLSDTSRDQAKQMGLEKVQPTKYQQSVLDSLGSDSAETTKKPKRKKKKGPNPLSCKKKSKISGPFAPKSPGIFGKGHKRRIRKRRQQAAYLLSKVPVPSSN